MIYKDLNDRFGLYLSLYFCRNYYKLSTYYQSCPKPIRNRRIRTQNMLMLQLYSLLLYVFSVLHEFIIDVSFI